MSALSPAASSRLAPLALGLALLGGCGVDDQATFDPGCFADADCPSGRCRIDGTCAPSDLERARGPFDVEVRPPPSSPRVATQRRQVEFPAAGLWIVTLPTPVVHEASIVGPAGPLAGDLVFQPVEGLADRPIDLVHQTLPEAPARVPLPPGRYGVRILPADRRFPAVQADAFSVEPGPPRQKALALPDRYRRLFGVVRSRVQASDRIAGARVFAVGVDSGLAATTALTGPDGRYELALPATGDTRFALTAEPPPEEAPAWRFAQVVSVPIGEDREQVIELDLPSAEVKGGIDLEVLGLGPRGPEPVASADVVLTSTSAEDGLSRSFVVRGRTDAEGRLRVADQDPVALLRGRYRIDIEPRPEAIWARAAPVLDFEVGGGAVVEAQVVLPPRPLQTGVLRDAAGRPVPFAQLSFLPADADGRVPLAETDADGRFAARIDPGAFVLLIEPQATSDQPSAALPVDVPNDVDPPRLDLRLPGATVVPGVARSESGVGLPEVEVSVFQRIRGRRVRVGRAVSDEDGAFELILPRRGV